MNLEQALKNIEAVLAAYKGTLQEHQALQSSLQFIKNELAKKEAKPEASEVGIDG
jgi:predicted RNase H-like HicB family nuclease